MNSSSLSSLPCPACGGENANDSRFCRHCGAVIEGTSSASAPAASADGVQATVAPAADSAVAATVAPPVNLDGEEMSSPSEIDGRRARQLLERALFLSERGDSGGAILAARQSIALAPNAPGGHSMLGLLLERSGDITHAASAYEKAVQLAPNSALERESLGRLREKLQSQQDGSLFHFDEDELFADTTPVAPPDKKNRKQENAVAAEPVVLPVAASAAVAAAGADGGVEHFHNIGAAAPGLPISYESTDAPAEMPTPDVSEFHGLGSKPSGAEQSISGLDARLPPTRSAASPDVPVTPVSTPAPAIPERRSEDRRRVAVPVVMDKRRRLDRRSAANTPLPAVPMSVAPIYIAGAMGSERPSGWRQLLARPSFYGRSLPLLGVTVLALGGLTWARSVAVAREPVSDVVVVPATGELPSQGTGETITNTGGQNAPPPLAPVGSASPQTGGFPISNRPTAPATGAAVPGAPTAPASPATTAPRSAAGSNADTGTAPRRIAAAPRSPQRSSPMIPPAAIPPASSGSGGGGRGSGGVASLGLPSPNIPPLASSAPPPVSVIPSGNTPSGNTPAGSSPPLNPSGSSGRGYVRITRGQLGSSSAPTRSSSAANNDERDAATASRAGNTDRAIDRLSSAINANASDAGFRFQQRASLFLDRGDYSRAAEDFQAAISAYNDQINRGEQVASARAGLRAARSGLNLALAGGRQ